MPEPEAHSIILDEAISYLQQLKTKSEQVHNFLTERHDPPLSQTTIDNANDWLEDVETYAETVKSGIETNVSSLLADSRIPNM